MKKDKTYKLRLTEDERKALHGTAAEAGMTTAELIRKAVVGVKIYSPRPDTRRQLVFEINKIGVLLNQAVHKLNGGMIGADVCLKEIAAFRSELSGVLKRRASAPQYEEQTETASMVPPGEPYQAAADGFGS